MGRRHGVMGLCWSRVYTPRSKRIEHCNRLLAQSIENAMLVDHFDS